MLKLISTICEFFALFLRYPINILYISDSCSMTALWHIYRVCVKPCPNAISSGKVERRKKKKKVTKM